MYYHIHWLQTFPNTLTFFVFIGNNSTRSTKSASFEYQKLDKAAIGNTLHEYINAGAPLKVAKIPAKRVMLE